MAPVWAEKKKAQERLNELHTIVQRKMADGTVTNRLMDQVESEAQKLLATIKSCDNAQSMSHMGDMVTPQSGNASAVDSGRRLSFKNMARPLSSKVLVSDLHGRKALAPSGAAVQEQTFMPDPVALGRPATSLLDVLPVLGVNGETFAYLRQSTRTNNAATVAAGAVKPTSVYSVTRVEQSLAVIAHLSEAIARYWLADNVALEAFINAELSYGLNRAVEAKIIADINATSGVQTQAYATSPLATLRKTITKLEANGLDPAALVLHPADWETVELSLASTNAVEHMALPYDAATRRLFGVPVVTSIAATAGTAHALAVEAVAVANDQQGVGFQWSENVGDSFSRNQIVARCETRVATVMYRPLGVVVATLTA